MSATAVAARPAKRMDWHRVSPGEPAHIFRSNGLSACGAVRADTRYAFAVPSWMVTAHDEDLCRECVKIARKFDWTEEY